MKTAMLWLIGTVLVAAPDSVEVRVRQAQGLLTSTPPAMAQALGILEGAVALCQTNLEAACAEAYAWNGVVLEAQANGNDEILRTRVEPLYARAVSLGGTYPNAQYLELHGRLLKSLGETLRAEPVLARAVELRKAEIAVINGARTYSGSAHRIGAAVGRPELVQRMEPAYTNIARILRYQGTAVLRMVVAPDGTARNVQLVKSLGFGLDEQAARAVQQWVFKPGTIDGQPVAVDATVEVNFRLL